MKKELPGKLIIARHHESEWNKLGKWTGKRDRHLTEYGFEKSEDMGLLIKDIKIQQAFASMQVRSIETLSCMLNICERYEVPTEHSAALNERDYGDYTGKNKWEMEKILGHAEYNKLRRSWNYPVPKGESLKDVYDRAVPFYLEKILPAVQSGNNVLVVAHGNSLRALIKYIESKSDEEIALIEVPFGSITMYVLDKEGKMIDKETRQTQSNVPA
jgi:2,3-bisphosphoglycerate-dependent phosphoglycerate mutase